MITKRSHAQVVGHIRLSADVHTRSFTSVFNIGLAEPAVAVPQWHDSWDVRTVRLPVCNAGRSRADLVTIPDLR
jgi:hypothetical protein